MEDSIKFVLERIDTSFALMTFQSRDGNLGTLVSPIGALPTPDVVITDETDILENSLVIEDAQDVATAIHAVYSFRYVSGQHGDPDPGQQFSRFCPNYEIPGTRNALRLSGSGGIVKEINLPYCRRTATVINVLRAHSEYLRPDAQYVTFNLPQSYFDNIDIGTYITLTHWQGTSAAGGFASVTVRALSVVLDPNPLAPSLHIRAFKRAPGNVLHDNFDRAASTSLGSTWTEIEYAADPLLSIAAVLGVEQGNGYNQTSALECRTNTIDGERSMLAYTNESVEDDQVAGIECMYRSAISNNTWGVCARASGTYASFTGYVARFTQTAASAYAVSLVKYVAADVNSAATSLGSYTLTVPTTDQNTWRSQGDIIELRCIGSRIEVFVWSDIPANNVGKVISVTDTSIESGAYGPFVGRGTADLLLTNFYGRGFR